MTASSATRDLEMSDLLDFEGYGEMDHMNGASSSNDASGPATAFAFEMPNDFSPLMSPPPQYEALLASSLSQAHDDIDMMNNTTFSGAGSLSSYMMQPQQAMSIDPTALGGASAFGSTSSAAYSQPSQPASISPASLVTSHGSGSRMASTSAKSIDKTADRASSSTLSSKSSARTSNSFPAAAGSSTRMSPVVEIPVHRASSASAPTNTKGKAPASMQETKGKRSESLPPAETSADEQWRRALSVVREHLTKERLRKNPVNCATKLGNILNLFRRQEDAEPSYWGDRSDVPPASRHEILLALKDADSAFWTAFLGRAVKDGFGLLYDWFLGATEILTRSKSDLKRDNPLNMTLVPLLQIFDKLDLTYDHYAQYKKLGARFNKLTRAPEFATTPVKPLAQSLVNKAVELSKAAKSRTPTGASAPQVKKEASASLGSLTKSTDPPKRKAEGGPSAPAEKKLKPALPTNASSTVPKAVAEPAPKLPSFRKNSTTPAVAAQPTVFRVMRDLQSKTVKKESSPGLAASAKSSNVDSSSGVATADGTKGKVTSKATTSGKARKGVRWTDDENVGPLVQYRYIEARDIGERAVMDGKNSAKAMMEAEEADAFSLDVGMEEEIQWYEPRSIVFPTGTEWEAFQTPRESEEAQVRPTTMDLSRRDVDSTSTVPEEAAAEPSVQDAGEPQAIPLSNDLVNDPFVTQAFAKKNNKVAAALAGPSDMGVAAPDQISALLAQLNGARSTIGENVHLPGTSAPGMTPLTAEALNQLKSFDPSVIRHVASGHSNFLAQAPRGDFHNLSKYDGYVPPSSFGTDAVAPRPKKRKGRMPCRFFNSPEGCRRGDQCLFKHD
ncbi:hypothetical protein OIV83_000326 [Microbotryomycetes sp. JL201]|nr:hypothetical protein OIV83_000326 [Microbotryomycetes sp. JL201]